MASNSRELAKTSDVAVNDGIPGAEQWGWHGGFPKGTIIGGVITIILCLVMIPGPYQSQTHVLYLVGVAVVVAGGIVGHVIRRRNAWRR